MSTKEPPPIATDRTPAWDLATKALQRLYRGKTLTDKDDPALVLADMAERDQIGREKHGVPLTSHNGRDHLIDAYQELLDHVVYLAMNAVSISAAVTTCRRSTCRTTPWKSSK